MVELDRCRPYVASPLLAAESIRGPGTDGGLR